MSYDLTLYLSKIGHPDTGEALAVLEAEEQDVVKGIHAPATIPPVCEGILNEMQKQFPLSYTVSSIGSIGINIAYGSTQKEASGMFKELNEFLKKLAEHGGYYVWDPQTGTAFDSKITDLNGMKTYAMGTTALQRVTNKKRPWWKL